jgi:hypothetical protein
MEALLLMMFIRQVLLEVAYCILNLLLILLHEDALVSAGAGFDP